MAVFALAVAMPFAESRAEVVVANLDFNQGFATGTTQTGAAAVGNAGDTWNGSASFGGFVGTETPSGNTGNTAPFGAFELLDTAGAMSGISYQMTFVNDGIDFQGVFSNFPAVAATAQSNLLGEYLFVGGADAGEVMSFELSGLATDTDYSLYLYGNGDGLGQGATWTLDGVAQTSAFDGTATLDEGGEYTQFTFNTGASTTQTFTATELGGSIAVNGFQLSVTAIPEPSSIGLLSLGCVAAVGIGRRRLRK